MTSAISMLERVYILSAKRLITGLIIDSDGGRIDQKLNTFVQKNCSFCVIINCTKMAERFPPIFGRQ